MKQQIVLAGQGTSYDWANDHIFVKSPHPLSDGRVTLVEDTLKPGFRLPRHHHKQMIEIFYILDGSVEFIFDEETVTATPGMTINVPPNTWHEVRSPQGGKLLTIFSPGGFDEYLATLRSLSEAQLADAAFLTALSERYDSWER